MDVFLHLTARRAFPTGILLLVACAEHILGKRQRQRQRAITCVPGKQLGMADTPCLKGIYQPVLDLFMSDYILKHKNVLITLT